MGRIWRVGRRATLTQGGDGDPAEDLGQDGFEVGELLTVRDRRKAVFAYHVGLLLRAAHALGMVRHGQ